jgi:cell division protein FtsL
MLSIMNLTNEELVPNPLHQIIAKNLSSSSPDWMIISTIILAVGTAVLVIVTYYYARQTRRLVGQTERLATSTEQSVTQASHFEQIKTSMYLWERINEKYDPIIKIGRSKGWPKDKSGIIDVGWEMLSPLVREIDFFAYLVLHDQIKDEKVLGYYRGPLSEDIKVIMKHYASADIRHDLLEQYPDFNRLIKKWNINIPDEET